MSVSAIRISLALLALGLLFVIYWPALHGGPIWDDFHFWFSHPSIAGEYSWIRIWLDFAWPMSVSVQKFLYQWLELDFFSYHVVNLVMHWLNTLLLWRIMDRWKVPMKDWIALLFLVHPANVITVAWMIQVKTLIAFLFSALALECLAKIYRHWMYWPLSWLMFLLAVLSKSSTIMLPVIFLVSSFSHLRTKQLSLMLPFFLISFWGTYRLYNSPVTTHALEMLAKKPPQDVSSQGPQKKYKTNIHGVPIVEVPGLEIALKGKIDPPERSVPSALYYYFWQAIAPTNLIPAKSLPLIKNEFLEVFHMVLLAVLVMVCWKGAAFGALTGAHLTLLPFLGILAAPYMNVSFVSDQHLYIGLPFILAVFAYICDSYRFRGIWLLPLAMAVSFAFKTRTISGWYQNEISFYSSIARFEPFNVPINYNLALSHLKRGELDQALEVTTSIINEGGTNKKVRGSQYYHRVVDLHFQIQTLRAQ